MRLIFAGTPEFAEKALAGLVGAGHEVALVLTQPDRRAGRGMQLHQSAVKRLALELGLPVYQPETLKESEPLERLRSANADAMVVAAYGLIVPQAVLDTVPWPINIHASLLPRWRGAAPIQRAILAGDAQTGISIMQMDVGLDTGPVLQREAIPISAEDDAGSLHDRLAALGADLVVRALKTIASGEARPLPQDAADATYAPKITRTDTLLDWRKAAGQLARVVRAFRPSPGASTRVGEQDLKVWRAHEAPGRGRAGELLHAGDALVVACGDGALEITEVQRPGGKRIMVADFLRSRPLAPGTLFGSTT